MGGASAQEERWRDTRSSCSLRSAALQDGGSAQAQEEVGHKKERRPRWRTWEEWKSLGSALSKRGGDVQGKS